MKLKLSKLGIIFIFLYLAIIPFAIFVAPSFADPAYGPSQRGYATLACLFLMTLPWILIFSQLGFEHMGPAMLFGPVIMNIIFLYILGTGIEKIVRKLNQIEQDSLQKNTAPRRRAYK